MTRAMIREIVDFARVVEDVCLGCKSKGSSECVLCEKRLQARLEELDLGGRY